MVGRCVGAIALQAVTAANMSKVPLSRRNFDIHIVRWPRL
jgi:hypothetical protein